MARVVCVAQEWSQAADLFFKLADPLLLQTCFRKKRRKWNGGITHRQRFFHERLVLVRAQGSGSGKDGPVRIQKILVGGADTLLVGPFIEDSGGGPEVFQRLDQGA